MIEAEFLRNKCDTLLQVSAEWYLTCSSRLTVGKGIVTFGLKFAEATRCKPYGWQ
jgi:hypothetical protein